MLLSLSQPPTCTQSTLADSCTSCSFKKLLYKGGFQVKQQRQNQTFSCPPVGLVSLHQSLFVNTQPSQIHMIYPHSAALQQPQSYIGKHIIEVFLLVQMMKHQERTRFSVTRINNSIPLGTAASTEFQPLQLKVDNASKKGEWGRRNRETRLRV